MTRFFVALASLFILLCSSMPYAPEASARVQASRQADPFAIPAGLEPAVKFWKKIFLEYDSTQLVFFDPRNMSRIHEVVRVKKGASTRRVIRSVRARLQRRGISSRRIKAQRGIRERFEGGVRRSGRYMEHMRKVFAARGLPVELTYLPLVESSFRNDARSFRGAVGMWQFMPGTGRRYMRVTRLVDERRDPMEATRAAARLLQENYRELRVWPLAVTAYNHGRAGMKRAVRQVGSRDIVKIIRRYRSRTFKFASKNFYAEFLAAVHIMRDVERHLPHVRFDPLVHLEEISLTKRVSVSSLLRHSRVSRAEFLKWNPALSRRAAWLPKGYRLKAPELQGQWFRKALAGIGPMSSFPYHVVSRGDTLSEIARVYGTSASAIQSINDLRSAHRLRVGQRLEIPGRSSARSRNEKRSVSVVDKPRAVAKRRAADKPRGAQAVADDKAVHHVVRRGDTLWDIARVHGTTARAIRSANGVQSVRRLSVGQRLEIPNRSSTKRVVKQRRLYHRVRRGETLSTIADRYRVSLAALQRANAIRDRHRIRVGQRLRIPGTQS
ncbi:MAG: LysM peptidoglycan-binding domain-containing protein [Deltaproteobacteria bacterium]|nr:LysM peptidoglycan-binding domain-containing protein [Deltaproteobacteria bacterium]